MDGPKRPWARARRRLLPRRFVVADRSMEPTLVAGQGLLAWWSSRAKPGQIRCLPHPTRADFWLVKRVDEVHPADPAIGKPATMTVLSDNREATVADSRTFGAVPVVGSYRVVIRVPL